MALRFIHVVFLLERTCGWGTHTHSAVAGAFIPGVRNPDIGSMEHIPKEFADAISTQPAYTTDHMMFAEQTHLIQGAQASQGAQTVGMPNRNSILAGITPEIWSNWDFDAVGPSRNDHIGPMDHNQQLQPHGLFRKPAHLYLPVNQEESEKGSQKRAVQNNECSLSGPQAVSKKPKNHQKTPFNPIGYDDIYMDLLGCLNEPNTIQSFNHPSTFIPGALKYAESSSAPPSTRGRVLPNNIFDSVSNSQLDVENSRPIIEELNQEEEQGGLFNEYASRPLFSYKSRNPIMELQQTQSNKDLPPLAYQSHTQLSDTSKKKYISCEENLERESDYMNVLSSQPPHVETYYSSHALSWFPTKICKKASIVTETLADKLVQSIISIKIKDKLEEMHQSHGILIPFTYDLALKDLTVSQWSKIQKAWVYIWQSFSESNESMSDVNILRTFVWVADYISEIASFKGFSHHSDGNPTKNLNLNPQIALVRHISLPNTAVYRLKDPPFLNACKTAVKYFLHEDPSIKFKDLHYSTVIELHTEVLMKLHRISHTICSACPTELRCSYQFSIRYSPKNLLSTLLETLQEKYIDSKNKNVISQLHEKFFQNMMLEDSSSTLYSGYSSKNFKKDIPLTKVLSGMTFLGFLPVKGNCEKFKFLPSIIRDHLSTYAS
ncbi:hypothetical protein MJO28_015119 [Puccinia striiformis f. sp. tritici]|uniref:Uncharacterized protein n=2 Tax=Puccinia striiformis f. sp. tritici TaxID=168172 RepID=A0A0L0UWH6_9BASI|nr:hypothetical protein MJO29_014887 [Puccinia striiformis f. sp. tritici]KAI7938199.1 hypothetical protein MJO28_015119 [Puccinia striiformis f. sp. tritici]KNE91291.1 hypothetical protein PSTG_15275 [Puccinia striiformis f. sp. tritici PST-78]